MCARETSFSFLTRLEDQINKHLKQPKKFLTQLSIRGLMRQEEREIRDDVRLATYRNQIVTARKVYTKFKNKLK